VWHDSSTYVTWLIHMCDMTHPHMWHDSSTCVTWLIHICDMTHPYMWHDSSTCVTWLIHICDMTHPHVCRDSFVNLTWRIASPAMWITKNSKLKKKRRCLAWHLRLSLAARHGAILTKVCRGSWFLLWSNLSNLRRHIIYKAHVCKGSWILWILQGCVHSFSDP